MRYQGVLYERIRMSATHVLLAGGLKKKSVLGHADESGVGSYHEEAVIGLAAEKTEDGRA